MDGELKIVGKLIEPFNPATMDWLIYEQLLINVLKLNNVVDDDKKKMSIMTMVGMTAFGELVHALDGKDMTTLTSENLLQVLRARYAPKKLVVAQRDKFLSIKQKPTQTFAELVAELQQAGSSCESEKLSDAKAARESYMLQAFLRAVRSEDIRTKILHQENLTFERAYELACIYETAAKEGPTMGKPKDSVYVSRIDNDRRHKPHKKSRHRASTPIHSDSSSSNSDNNSSRRPKGCWRCGHEHEYKQCPAFHETCKKCGVKGHFAIGCKASRRRNSPHPRANHISSTPTYEPPTYDFEYDTSDCPIRHVEAVPAETQANSCDEPPRMLTIQLNGKPVSFELDTGASVSLISEADWKAIGRPKLSDAKATITAYQGCEIPVHGTTKVHAELAGTIADIDVYVVPTGVALCGRTTIAALSINCGPYYAPRIGKTDNRDAWSLDHTRQEDARVFSDDTGTIADTCSLELTAITKPYCCATKTRSLEPTAIAKPIYCAAKTRSLEPTAIAKPIYCATETCSLEPKANAKPKRVTMSCSLEPKDNASPSPFMRQPWTLPHTLAAQKIPDTSTSTVTALLDKLTAMLNVNRESD